MALSTGATLPTIPDGNLQLFIDAYRAQSGRPTTFNELLAAEIIERLANGETLTAICRNDGMPTFSCVMGWAKHVPSFGAAIADARQQQATALADQAVEILDEAPTDSMAHVQKADKRAILRMNLAKCFDRETFGDKVQQDVNLRGVVITTADPNLRRLLEE